MHLPEFNIIFAEETGRYGKPYVLFGKDIGSFNVINAYHRSILNDRQFAVFMPELSDVLSHC